MPMSKLRVMCVQGHFHPATTQLLIDTIMTRYQNNHKSFLPKRSVGWHLPWNCACVFQMSCKSFGSPSRTWEKEVQGGGVCLGWQPGHICPAVLCWPVPQTRSAFTGTSSEKQACPTFSRRWSSRVSHVR